MSFAFVLLPSLNMPYQTECAGWVFDDVLEILLHRGLSARSLLLSPSMCSAEHRVTLGSAARRLQLRHTQCSPDCRVDAAIMTFY